jgi:hypothetical protein
LRLLWSVLERVYVFQSADGQCDDKVVPPQRKRIELTARDRLADHRYIELPAQQFVTAVVSVDLLNGQLDKGTPLAELPSAPRRQRGPAG